MTITRALLAFVLALSVLAFRTPVGDFSALADVSVSDHDHHGHSHDDEAAPPLGEGHDHQHVGDHSHETPCAVHLQAFRIGTVKNSKVDEPDAPMTSVPAPPGERPPRIA